MGKKNKHTFHFPVRAHFPPSHREREGGPREEMSKQIRKWEETSTFHCRPLIPPPPDLWPGRAALSMEELIARRIRDGRSFHECFRANTEKWEKRRP